MDARESDFDQLVAGLTVKCDGTDPKDGNCDQSADWHFNYHGCNEELLCEGHANAYVSELIFLLARYGAAICSACGKTSMRLFDHIGVTKL